MHKRSAFGYAVALGALVSFGSGCGEESSVGSSDGALRGGVRPDHAGGAGEGSDDDEDAVPGQGWVPGDEVPEGFCEHGGAVGRIDVAFECDAITIITCKDLSNVVLEYEDGTRQKFDGLSGQSGAFSGTDSNAGKVIVGVWVKAGANFSGDGPGYGERFDAPGEQACEDGGDGDGDGDDACDDLDEDCGGPPPGDGDGDDGECDDLDEDCGGDPPPSDPNDPNFCIFEPDSPLCHVD